MPINNNNPMELTHSKFSLKKTEKKKWRENEIGDYGCSCYYWVANSGKFPEKGRGSVWDTNGSMYPDIYIYIYNFLLIQIKLFYFY